MKIAPKRRDRFAKPIKKFRNDEKGGKIFKDLGPMTIDAETVSDGCVVFGVVSGS